MGHKEKAPSRQAEKFIIRMPDGLRSRIANSASLNHRSMNAEVVSRLLRSLEVEDINQLGVREPPPQYSDSEARLLLAFRALPEDKQRALLQLIA